MFDGPIADCSLDQLAEEILQGHVVDGATVQVDAGPDGLVLRPVEDGLQQAAQ